MKYLTNISIALLLSTGLSADLNLENELLSLLDEATTIATSKKVNVSHQPSTISVLNYEDIKMQGFKNIHEAIASLPGFEGYITNIGWKELAVRGVYTANAYGFDKIKLLVDGVSINNALYGSIYYYLDLPIDLVERIEVLRGPGSVKYGTGAFSGAINIITKKEKTNKVFMGFDSYSYKILGAKQFTKLGDFDLYLDGYFQATNKAVEDLNERRHTNDIPVADKTNERLRDGSVGIIAEKEDLKIASRFKKSENGDYYGNYEYEFGPNKESGSDNTHFFIELEKTKELENVTFNAKAGYKFYEFDSNLYDTPSHKLITDYSKKIREYVQKENDIDTPAAVTLTEELGLFDFIKSTFNKHERLGYFANEYTTYFQTSLQSTVDNHHLEFGVLNEYVKNTENYTTFNYKTYDEVKAILKEIAKGNDPYSYEIAYDPTLKKENGFIGSSAYRTTNSVYLTDFIVVDDKTDMSFGYRIDDYSDIHRKHPSYNIGIVHRKDENLIYKLAHGSAFRAPSFIEIYSQGSDFRQGNTNLKPENIRTTEASILYSPNSHIQLNTTIYKSVLTDAIDLAIDCEDLSDAEKTYISCEESNSFSNYPRRTVKGIEVEYHHKLNTENHLAINYTKLKTLATGWQPFITVENKKDIPLVDIADEMANISHTYFYNQFLSFNTNLEYISQRTQNSREETLPKSIIIDENINYRASNDMLVQFSIKNLFNERKHNQSVWGFHEEGLLRESRYFALKVILEL